MFVIAGGTRVRIGPKDKVDPVIAGLEAAPEYVDVPLQVRRMTLITALRIFSLLPQERKAPIACYVDAAGDFYCRFRLLSREDAGKVCRAVAYYETVGPMAGFRIAYADTAEQSVMKMAEFDSWRILLILLGVLRKDVEDAGENRSL